MTKENKKRLILLGIVVVFIAIYLLVPQVNSSINSAMAAFGKGFDGVFAYFLGAGAVFLIGLAY